ncbi:TPA: hypothetical protein ACGO3T_000228 [Streptococcus suis]
MKQLKPFTKISLSLLGLGAILSLIGYLAGGWTNMKNIGENYFQPQTASFTDIRSIEVNERLSISPRLTTNSTSTTIEISIKTSTYPATKFKMEN